MTRETRARALLGVLGVRAVGGTSPAWAQEDDANAAAWARSGALWLTGPPAQCVLPDAPLPHALEAALDALRLLCPGADLEGMDARLLGERAALAGLSRQGARSCGGSARLLPVGTEWVAPNLPRDDDWRLVPAWLERPVDAGDWASLAQALGAAGPPAPCVRRGRELGLAIGWHDPDRPARAAVLRRRPGRPGARLSRPWVLDLSSLWAGPLCADLLRRCGARVTKVESRRRPDGARRGPAAFFDLMNAGKESVALALDAAEGRAALHALVARADVVLESARPRALAQLGIDAARWVAARPGRVWASITGYGRGEPDGGWVAFGDDAAVSAGLLAGQEPKRFFVGDAIADPVAGATAAAAIVAALQAGGGELVDVSLADTIAAALARASGGEAEAGPGIPARPPTARSVGARGPALGADTERILAEIGASVAHPPHILEAPA